MFQKSFCYFVIAVVVLAGGVVFTPLSRAGYESAEYSVVESEGNYEIRQYPDLMLVATRTKIDAQGRDGSFMKLFRYISGDNESEQQIAMTTPVFMQQSNVATGENVEVDVQMGFVMPKAVASEGVPKPKGPEVDVRKRPGGRFAVLRFSGRMDAQLAKESESKLREWMRSKGLTADDSPDAGGVESASYDPPFTPGPLRRNEVLIRLK